MATVSKIEVPNHTPEQAQGFLAAALDLLDTLPVPEDIRGEFFVQAVLLLSGKQIVLQPNETPVLGVLGNHSHRVL